MGTLALPIRRRRASAWSLLAITAAALTGLAVLSYLRSVKAQIPVAGKLVPMVVAARDLLPGTRLDADDLALQNHPEKYLPDGALRSLDLAVGKVISAPVFTGEPITARRLGRTGGLSSVIPAGMRAYSLGVDSGASLDFLPRPGDRVDVIATFPKEVLGESYAVTILRSKEVAAVGVTRGELSIDSGGDRLPITLFVTPEEAQELALAEALGRITVVLSPFDSPEDVAPSGVRPQDLGR